MTIMSETERIHSWLKNVIASCTHPYHITLCEVLISFYEKKDAQPYLIKNLREYLNMKIKMIETSFKNEEYATIEEEVWKMFKSGNYTMTQISQLLNIKYLKCQEIINKKTKEQK